MLRWLKIVLGVVVLIGFLVLCSTYEQKTQILIKASTCVLKGDNERVKILRHLKKDDDSKIVIFWRLKRKMTDLRRIIQLDRQMRELVKSDKNSDIVEIEIPAVSEDIEWEYTLTLPYDVQFIYN